MCLKYITQVFVILLVVVSESFGQGKKQTFSSPRKVRVVAWQSKKEKFGEIYYEDVVGRPYSGKLIVTHYKRKNKRKIVEIDSVNVISGFERGWQKTYSTNFSDSLPSKIRYAWLDEELTFSYNQELYQDSGRLEVNLVRYTFFHSLDDVRTSMIVCFPSKDVYVLYYLKKEWNMKRGKNEYVPAKETFSTPEEAMDRLKKIAVSYDLKEVIEESKGFVGQQEFCNHNH